LDFHCRDCKRFQAVAQHPDLVQKMVNVSLRANRFIATHSAAGIAAALPPSIVQDSYIFVKSVEHTRSVFSEDGAVIVQGVANNIQSQKTLGTVLASQTLDPTDFFDMSFVTHAMEQRSNLFDRDPTIDENSRLAHHRAQSH
jgi:ABC-type nitrate/sulfonate/bicarbonate transport system substrate-binding protein